MQIPEPARLLIDVEFRKLAESNAYYPTAERRLEIYAALGPSTVAGRVNLDTTPFPPLSAADPRRWR